MPSPTLPRDVLRWLQGMDLSVSINSPKWDISNGYLVGEICSWYFPHDIEFRMFHNATTLQIKLHNWLLLKKLFRMKEIAVSADQIDAVIHCKPNASQLFICNLYQQLTNRKINDISGSKNDTQEKSALIKEELGKEYSDALYQSNLPFHCKSTAIHSLRNNIRTSEYTVCQDYELIQEKARQILIRHEGERARQRKMDPDRFKRRPTMGERAQRKSPPPSRTKTESSQESSVSQYIVRAGNQASLVGDSNLNTSARIADEGQTLEGHTEVKVKASTLEKDQLIES